MEDSDLKNLTHSQVLALYQDLQIHQEELAAQNEELVEANHRREEAETLYQTLFAALPIPFCVIDGSARVTEFNSSFLQLIGSPKVPLHGRSIAPYVSPIDEFFRWIEVHKADQPSLQLSNVLEVGPSKKNAPKTSVKIAFTRVEIERAPRYLITFTDISAERAEQRILKAADETKAQFVANMSHEVRSPLHGVIGNLELALDTESPDEKQALIRAALSSGKHLLDIVNDILDYSKLEAGSFVLHPEPTDVNRLMLDIQTLMQPLAQNKKLALTVHLPTPPIYAELDPIRLRQIVLNLLTNAIKFTHKGSVALEVNWAAGDNGIGRLEVRVSDTGVGIKPADLTKIFRSFEQVGDSNEAHAKGTGLGLTIVQRLASLMQGEVDVKSSLGQGSLFTVSFPAPQARKSAIEMPSSEPSDLVETSLSGLTVLLVDDSAMNRMLGEKMIKRLGANCILANHGGESIDKLSIYGDEIDVVLMDIKMPVIDGTEAIRRIRTNSRWDSIPIIAATANVQETDTRSYLELGAAGVLGKPFTQQDLYKVIQSHIKR